MLGVIRDLRARWHQDDALQAGLGSAFDRVGFTADYVSRCTQAMRGGFASRKRKYIKDNVWGMITADPSDVRLLDAPILQRLRAIKQLGLSYLTYPSAEHSRFIHSLGMSWVVTEFLRSIDRRIADRSEAASLGRWAGSADLDAVSRDDIVHAALLHDVGHMPFSHASEGALHAWEDLFWCGNQRVGDMLYDVNGRLNTKLGLSEVLSLLVVLSDRFSAFYDEYVRESRDDDAILRIACLIAGRPPAPRLSGIAEIISSSAIDADKIDYVRRDAKACGIPVGIDIARIFLRSAFVELTRDDLIKAQLKDDPAPLEVLFVVNASGVDTLDEITQSRASLYQRVYLHPVTRTAEALLGRGLQENAMLSEEEADPDMRDAIRLWSLNDSELLRRLAESKSSRVQRLGLALRGRFLPKKACVFSASIANMHMPLKTMFRSLDPSRADDLRKLIVNTKLEELTSDELRGQKGRQLEEEIRAESERLAQLLRDSSAPAELVPTTPLQDLAVVGTSYMDRARKDCVVLQNGELLRTSKFTNVRQTQDAFDIVKAVGFVMADVQWAPIVLLASRVVLGRPVGPPKPADFPSVAGKALAPPTIHVMERMILDLKGVLRRAGVPREKLDATREAATNACYFDRFPVLARTEDAGSVAIKAVADKLASFDGEGTWRVRPESVAAFLDQFPPRLREPMLETLDGLVFFDAETVAEAVASCLQRVPKPRDIVPLSPSSGVGVVTAIQRRFHDSSDVRINFEVGMALRDGRDGPIVFVDDNCSSGTQARAQFLQWMGVARDQWPPECRSEDHLWENPLTAAELENLKRRTSYVAVCAGNLRGGDLLKATLEGHGMTNFQGLVYAHSIGDAPAWPADLREFLTEVGRSILRWANRDKGDTSDAFVEANAFGYGNVGALISTATNVPTSTVTALWCPGIHNNSPWLPLVIRQRKLRHLILA